MTSVDDILFDFIGEKFSEIKSDPNILDTIFDGKPVDKIEQVKQYLLTNDVKVVYHHPRDEADIPCVAIVLESSTESDQVVGQSGDMYDEVVLSNMEDGWISSDSDIFRSNTSLPTEVYQLYSALEVKDGRRSCHFVGKKGVSNQKGIWIDFRNSVLEGGYVSLVGMDHIVFWIKSNRVGTFLSFGFGKEGHLEKTFPITVTTKNLWERIRVSIEGVPNTEKDKIRYMSLQITDDSGYTDIYVDRLTGEKSLGYFMEEVFLDTRYRIETWSNNAELTLILYTILLWNFLTYRTYLESSWGLCRQRVDGGDIMPQPEFYPEFVYVRGLVYSCTTVETVPREGDITVLDARVGRIDSGSIM